jgi:hypothetical protein
VKQDAWSPRGVTESSTRYNIAVVIYRMKIPGVIRSD